MAVSTLSARCLNLRQTVIIARQIQTSAVLTSDEKTPIQKVGWEYLVKQEASGRPLSPHLSIYKPQLTWMLSGFHRITGCVMAGTLLVGGVGFWILPLDFTTFIEFLRNLNLPCTITGIFKFIIAFPIGFDLAKGTDIQSVYRSGWLVLGLSALITLAVVANSCQKNASKTK
ncbi:hypothetical protein FO519_002481 [Halicephalobus sp. NKZ332]|nr:hypothetical protein FO519_002481 [Halicephalobus sp. NKZ332]